VGVDSVAQIKKLSLVHVILKSRKDDDDQVTLFLFQPVYPIISLKKDDRNSFKFSIEAGDEELLSDLKIFLS
jgi:hypothetical protein